MFTSIPARVFSTITLLLAAMVYWGLSWPQNGYADQETSGRSSRTPSLSHANDLNNRFPDITDAGDIFASANTVGLDSGGRANIAGAVGFGLDAGDYYRFAAPATGTATFSLVDLSDDIDLRLYDSGGSELYRSTSSGTFSESLTFPVTRGRTYYLHADPWDDSSRSSYNMSVILPANDQDYPFLVDEDENYWDASIMAAPGIEISAEDAQLFGSTRIRVGDF